MIVYRIKSNNTHYLLIERLIEEFFLLPCRFQYEKRYPEGKDTYKRVIDIKFHWMFWRYNLLIRKERK